MGSSFLVLVVSFLLRVTTVGPEGMIVTGEEIEGAGDCEGDVRVGVIAVGLVRGGGIDFGRGAGLGLVRDDRKAVDGTITGFSTAGAGVREALNTAVD